MTNPMVVEGLWHEFEKDCVPAHASTLQRAETRKAFIAGALALFSKILTTLDEEEGASPADLQFMDHLHQEFAAFAAQLCAELQRTPT